MQTQLQQSTKASQFPFTLKDLVCWTVKRKDGTSCQFFLQEHPVSVSTAPSVSATVVEPARTATGLSQYCSHFAKDFPAFKNDKLSLRVCDYSGARHDYHKFDFVVDGGDVLDDGASKDKLLTGNEEMVAVLAAYVNNAPRTKVLKIDWFDRAAPKVRPEFWPALNALLHGEVMTCCVGGHGRSGTAFVCLLMCNAPDYDALDAVVHLRAMHCPRAIESVSQHDYINEVAKSLGREANARDAIKIADYKAAFLASDRPTAIATRKELGLK